MAACIAPMNARSCGMRMPFSTDREMCATQNSCQRLARAPHAPRGLPDLVESLKVKDFIDRDDDSGIA
jgi:hypothetical protein